MNRMRLVVTTVLFAVASLPALAGDFADDLARIDAALAKNPSKVLPQAINSCLSRRSSAITLFNMGYTTRAERRLKHCFDALQIPETAPVQVAVVDTQQQIQERATRELERALTLEPNVTNGLEIYRECAACHLPEGWGLDNGMVPQLAGQHRTVVIKQLADIRAGNRENPLMAPYSSVETIGGAQAVADVAGYIDTLEISVENGKGSGENLELGATLYAENCARCHGEQGEGDPDRYIPRIQSQHYEYLVRQFEWIRNGKRRNSDPEMVAQIESFDDRQMAAVLDYVSRLQPPEAFQAPPGWRNPDFAAK